MSDLGGLGNVRASNGTSRGAGPVPVAQQGSSSSVRTPRDIMKDRNEREARRRAEAQQVEREKEERRRSAERRAIAAAAGVTPLTSTSRTRPLSGEVGQSSAQRAEPLSTGRTPMRTAQQAYPTPSTGGTADEPQPLGRTRASSKANDEPRAAPVQPARRPVPSSNLRQSSAPTQSTPQNTNTANATQPRSNVSSFPHAFERWEQLSSHWEGLTSYWLHKLESNQEAIARNVPSASAMSRQITDLSAAGANLFHAVVELQRLRASSERKFQRWFFETRNEQEKDRERIAELERALAAERDNRTEGKRDIEDAKRDRDRADKMLREMRRELNISKEEARRAWEELGRREQEERDRTMSLKEGMPTVVGGVQVVPMHASQSAGVSRQGSQSQRPETRDGRYTASQDGRTGYSASEARYPPSSQSYAGEGYYDDQRPGSANTDPFSEDRSVPPLHHEPDMPSLSTQAAYAPYQGSTPATSGSVQTAIPAARPAPLASNPAQSRRPVPGTASGGEEQDEPERFYQQPPRSALLHDPNTTRQDRQDTRHERASEVREDTEASRLASPDAAARAARDLRSEPSYVSSVSEEGTEYEIDDRGVLRRDAEGRPLVYRPSGRPAGTGGRSSGWAQASQPAEGEAATEGYDEGTVGRRIPTADEARRMGLGSEASDEYDVQADVEREREYSLRYGRQYTAQSSPFVGVEAPSPPSALASAGRVPGQGQGVAQAAGEQGEQGSGYTYGEGGEVYEDYPAASAGGTGAGATGAGRGAAGPGGWETLQTRHHHPTRLSDVIEEEEGSVRGGPASQRGSRVG
ncbi:Hypothetical protein D9617_22g066680 [Elsinoe fawcettii]|nr:Hypothetical protein D9617_22g066680 [Elsinoe fawcettii]